MNSLIFADDLVLLGEGEDKLQLLLYKFVKLAEGCDYKISTSKTKIMAFWGSDPIRSKIVILNKVLEQVSQFNYLGCDVSFLGNLDLVRKINRFQQICRTLIRSLENKTRIDTLMKFYKVMALPTLLCSSESWTMPSREMQHISNLKQQK